MSDNRWTRYGPWWLVLVVFASACDGDVLSDDGDIVYLTPWGENQIDVVEVRDSRPNLSSQDEANAEMVIANFEDQSEALLQRPGVDEILGQIEQSYLFSGNYHRLIDIYRDHYERHGIESIAAIGLAWTHIQLENEVELVELEKRLIEERADDPLTWVIVGEANMRRAAQSPQAAIWARDAFERLLELDPDFQEFKTLSRARLQQQLEQLRIEAPDDDVVVDDEAASPMHHVDGEAASAPVSGADMAEVEAEPQEDHADQEQLQEEEERAGDDAKGVVGDTVEPAARQAAAAIAEQHQAEIDDEAQAAEDEAQSADDDAEERRRQAITAVMNGQQALQQGDQGLPEARGHFEQALDYDPDNVDAQIGMLRVQQRLEASDSELLEAVDELKERILSARQAYDLALFCLRGLNDRDRATSLLQRVEQKDPSFARRVGVDSLLE